MKHFFLSIYISLAYSVALFSNTFCYETEASFDNSLNGTRSLSVRALGVIPSCYDNLNTLFNEVRRNCSISQDVVLRAAPYYKSSYSTSGSLLEDVMLECPFCSKFIKFFLPGLKNYGGTHTIHAHCTLSSQASVSHMLDIASLYHHMGHIEHEDAFNDAKIQGTLRFNEHIAPVARSIPTLRIKYGHFYKEVPEKKLYESLIQKKAFVEDLKEFALCVGEGKRFVQESHSQAALITLLHAYQESFLEKWDLACDICKSKITYKRGTERRADLFALKKLWENGRTDVIMAHIYMHAFSGSLSAINYDIHPSGLERALAALGFLASKRFDIAQAALNFEASFLSTIRTRNNEYLLRHLGPEWMREHREHEEHPILH